MGCKYVTLFLLSHYWILINFKSWTHALHTQSLKLTTPRTPNSPTDSKSRRQRSRFILISTMLLSPSSPSLPLTQSHCLLLVHLQHLQLLYLCFLFLRVIQTLRHMTSLLAFAVYHVNTPWWTSSRNIFAYCHKSSIPATQWSGGSLSVNGFRVSTS